MIDNYWTVVYYVRGTEGEFFYGHFDTEREAQEEADLMVTYDRTILSAKPEFVRGGP